MTVPPFTLVPIPDATAAALRAEGGDTYVADSFPGYPCRQCLRDAAIGEELILVSHDPFDGASPYRSSSPIFLHADTCERLPANHDLPEQLTRRQLSVRAFDADEMMLDAAVIDGDDLAATMTRFFQSSSIERIHIHNASRGCWAVSVERADTVTPS